MNVMTIEFRTKITQPCIKLWVKKNSQILKKHKYHIHFHIKMLTLRLSLN